MEERYNLGKNYARNIAFNYMLEHGERDAFNIPDSEWYVDIKAVNNVLAQGKECLVYSFGISIHDPYTEYFADKGCEVFEFYPTILPDKSQWRSNIHYHPWGDKK